MKGNLVVIGTLCMLIGCHEMEIEVTGRPFLREKFNGKYELLSARSEVAVDLNNDGIASSNLLDENSTVWFSSLEVRIPDESELFLEHNGFVFTEFWPTENDQRLRVNGFIPTYDTPVWGPYYDLYGQTFVGYFGDDFKSGYLQTPTGNDGKNTLIEVRSIRFLEDELIEIAAFRRLYTNKGWVELEIVSVYRRYTKVT